jgi:hypothetical protein
MLPAMTFHVTAQDSQHYSGRRNRQSGKQRKPIGCSESALNFLATDKTLENHKANEKTTVKKKDDEETPSSKERLKLRSVSP